MSCEGQLWLFAFTINHDINDISGKSIVVRLWYKVLQEPAPDLYEENFKEWGQATGFSDVKFCPPQKKIPERN